MQDYHIDKMFSDNFDILLYTTIRHAEHAGSNGILRSLIVVEISRLKVIKELCTTIQLLYSIVLLSVCYA